jgi:hypothetical protein
LDEGSARRRDLYLTTQTLYKKNIHAPGGIRTHDPRKRSAADLRLRLRVHWIGNYNYRVIKSVYVGKYIHTRITATMKGDTVKSHGRQIIRN